MRVIFGKMGDADGSDISLSEIINGSKRIFQPADWEKIENDLMECFYIGLAISIVSHLN
jgi:hypothetical protein